MSSKIKWYLNGIAATIFVIVVVIYLVIRPVVVQNLEPVLKQAAAEKLNGEISWQMMDLDPRYNLSFDGLLLKDENGHDVLRTPNMTIDWSLCGIYNYYMNNGTLLDIIKEISIQKPELFLQEKSDGTWNIQNIVKDNAEEPKGTFKGKVAIDEGKVRIGLFSGDSYELEELQGKFNWQNDDKIKGDFKGKFLNSEFYGTLFYTDENNLEAEIKADAVSLESLKPLFQKLPETQHSFDIQSGTGKITGAKIWRSDGAFSYHVKGRLEQTVASYKNYTLTDGAAFFDIYNKNISIKDFFGKINGQSVSGHMEIDLTNDDSGLLGQIKLSHIAVEKILTDSDITGQITGSVNLGGTVSEPLLDGVLQLKAGSYKNLEIKDGKGEFSYYKNNVNVSSLEAHAAGGFVTGRGHYNTENGYFNIRAVVEECSLDQLPLEDSMAGMVSGSLEAEGNYFHDEMSLAWASAEGKGNHVLYRGQSAGNILGTIDYKNGNFRTSFTGNDITVEGVRADSAAGHIEGQGKNYYISYLNGTIEDGTFSVKGFWGEDKVNLDVKTSGVDISSFSDLAGIDISGTASLSMVINGTTDNPRARGEASVYNGHFDRISFDSLQGQFAYSDKLLSLDSVEIKDKEGKHIVNGFIGTDDDHVLNLNIKSKKIRIEDLLKMGNLSYPVTGWIENTLHVNGSLEAPVITGDFLAWDGSVSRQLFQSASGRYSFENNIVTIKDGLVYIYDGVGKVNGTVSNNRLDMDILFADVDAGYLLADKGVHGKVGVKGQLSGTFDNPLFHGMVQSREVTLEGGKLHMLSMGIDYRDHVLSVTDGSFRQGEGLFKWKGLYNNQSGVLSGNLEFNNWDINEIAKIFKLPISNSGGTVDGAMSIKGTMENPDVVFRAKINGGHLADTVVGEGEIDLSYINKALSIRKLYIPVGDGILAAQGGMSGNGDLDLKIAANHMDISWIPQVMGYEDSYFGGYLTAAADLKGTKANPQVDFSVGIEKPQYNDYVFDSLSFMGITENDTIHISQALIKKEPYKISGKGSMPVNMITRKESPNSSPLDLEINLDNADLNAVGLFLKPVTSAQGPVKGKVKVTGSWNDPEVYGNISVKNGQMTLATLSDPLMPVDGMIDFHGREASLEGAAVFGSGKASAEGTVSWNHSTITGYTGEAHVHGADIHSTYYKGAMDADLTFGEVKGMPGIIGDLHVHDATIDIPLSLLLEESSGTVPLAVDMNVILGDNVRLYNSSLYNILLKGNIDAVGPLDSPYVLGKVNVEKGTIKVNMTEFKIDSGRAVWGGDTNGILPDVDVKASAKVSDYNIWTEIKGIPGHITTTFRSEPYLNDSQILMLLTLHANPNGENQEAIDAALFNAGLTLVFGNEVQNFFKDTIGLDLISVTSSLTDYYDSSSADDNYYYIKIGKYLFNDFMLTATTGVNNEQKSIGFHYDVNSRIGISAWYNNEHDSYIGTDWKFKF